MSRVAPRWQLLLADLSLILFLFALVSLGENHVQRGQRSAQPVIAPAQALYRFGEAGPPLSQWLAERPADPRATLTVFARHSSRDEAEMWAQARRLSRTAIAAGYEVRVVLTRGQDSDVYASLAYDEPPSLIAQR